MQQFFVTWGMCARSFTLRWENDSYAAIVHPRISQNFKQIRRIVELMLLLVKHEMIWIVLQRETSKVDYVDF